MDTTWSKLPGFVELTKPRLLFLLFITAFIEALALYFKYPSLSKIILLSSSIILSCAGTNALSCYLDRDIDSIMSRTIQRPLPRGVVGEREALHFGITLLLSGLAITLFINFYVTLWGVLGSAFVLGYNWKLKRLTPWNVLIASPGGAAPVLGAYSAMTGSLLGLESILLALLIIFWTPVHIWSLAIFYDKDYRRAGVPMLPVVKKESIVNRMILFFSSLYLLDALALFLKSGITPSALLVFLLLSYPLIKLSIRIYYNYSPSLQLGLFKLSNLHLASVFLAHLFFSSL